MAIYSYKAIDSDGKEKKGTIDGDTKDDAAKKLKDKGLVPMTIGEQGALDKDIQIPFLGGGAVKPAKPRDLSVFCRQFGSILKAGVSVVNALEMLRDQTEDKKLQMAIGKVQVGVEMGETLSGSMAKEPAFPSILVDMINAGEASGSLETSLERMAVQFEKNAKMKGIVKKALMYPAVLSVVAVGVVVILLVFVIPSFVGMFAELGTDLPFMTQLMLDLSNSLQSYWYIYIAVIALIVIGYKTFVATDQGRHVIDRLMIKLPVFGILQAKSACAGFARTMSTLLMAGMPMMDALDIASSTMTNVIYADALEKVKSGVALGIPMSKQLAATEEFPAMLVHMTSIGEETGNIEEMLNNIAGYYEEEVELATQQVTALMEPVIIIVMALIVVVIIMAVYTPMISLYDTLG